MIPPRPFVASGTSTPAAIAACPAIQRARSESFRLNAAAANVLKAAAKPNIGHDQPYTAGSGKASRAIAERNVAGMM